MLVLDRRGGRRRRVRGRPARARLPHVADGPRVNARPDRARRSAARARCAAVCGCRATSRSRTARCCSPRWPTGRSTITNLATGADVRATRAALRRARRRPYAGAARRSTVSGGGLGAWREPDDVDRLREQRHRRCACSPGALAGRPFLSVLTGDASLRQRPMATRRRAAARDGRARSTAATTATRAPLVIRGGALRGMRHELPVASAQVKSALMLAGLQADGETEVVSPAPSRDHTERMLGALGVPVEVDGLPVRVRAGAPEPFELEVPGDPSSAAFFVVAARDHARLRSRDRSRCRATRPGSASSTCCGAWAPTSRSTPTGERCGEPVGDLRVRASRAARRRRSRATRSPTCIDEIPALAVAAAFADGVTEVRDAAELAVKESNRIGTLHEELTQLGRRRWRARADGLSIRGGRPRASATSRATAITASRWRGGRGQRDRRRVDGAGLATRSRRRIPGSPTTSPG